MKNPKNGLEVRKIDGYDFGYLAPAPTRFMGFGIYDHDRRGFICFSSKIYGPYRSKSRNVTLEVVKSLSRRDLKTVGIAKPVPQ